MMASLRTSGRRLAPLPISCRAAPLWSSRWAAATAGHRASPLLQSRTSVQDQVIQHSKHHRLFSSTPSRRLASPAPSPSKVPAEPYEPGLPLAGSVHEHSTHLVLHPISRLRPQTSWPSHPDALSPLLSELQSRAKTSGSLRGCFTTISEGGRPSGFSAHPSSTTSTTPSLRDWDPKTSKFQRLPPGSAEEEELFLIRAYRPGKIVELGPLSYNTLDRGGPFHERLEEAFKGARSQSARPHEGDEAHIYVCTHGERDCRCSEAGGEVLEALNAAKRELEANVAREGGRMKKIRIMATSHVGGHKYAANAIVHPHGDWYGNLRPSDARLVLRAALAPATSHHDLSDEREKLVHWPRWRGRMGWDEVRQNEHASVWGPEVIHSARLTPIRRGGGAAAASAAPGAGAAALTSEGRAGKEDPAQEGGSKAAPPPSSSSIPVRFVTHEGEEHLLEGSPGETLMELAKRHDMPSIEATCGGKCECATCHAYVPLSPSENKDDAVPSYILSSAPISDDEDDMLEYAIDRRNSSRLLCQIKLDEAMRRFGEEGGKVRLPRF